MRILKRIGIALAALIALVLIVAAFVPKVYTVSVTQHIKAPQETVFLYLSKFANQKQYSIWMKMDPALQETITGKDGQLGAIQTWDSKVDDVGAGEQEIIEINSEKIKVEIRFKRPFEGKLLTSTICKPVGAETDVTMEFTSESNYPMNLPSYLFGKSYMEKSISTNLQNVKQILEN